MKAQILRAFGDADQLELTDWPDPDCRAGEVLVRIGAASINPVDYKSRQAGPPFAPQPPAVMGMDLAGTVERVGDGVTEFQPGDKVYGCAGGIRGLGGTYAELIATDHRLLAKAPTSLSIREVAALPLVSITAWEALHDRAHVKSGDKVLVHAGTGGVGHIGIQLAKAAGAWVCATVSNDDKARISRQLGADETINYRTEAPADYVARLTDGQGFDIVLDTVGGDNIAPSLDAARLNGTVVTIMARANLDLGAMHVKGLSLHAVFMLIPMIHDVGRARHGAILTELAALVDAGKVKPLLDELDFTLAQLPDAMRRLESGAAIGKVVVTV